MSSLQQSSAPAGGYRGPLGLPQVRWWNGMGWTNRIEAIRPEIHVAEATQTLVSNEERSLRFSTRTPGG